MSSDSASPKRFVKCPRCKTQALFSPENPSRPFCSERCKMIDLGQWADESFRIPSTPTDIHEDISSGAQSNEHLGAQSNEHLGAQSNEHLDDSSNEDLN